jgi:hypothetical protein
VPATVRERVQLVLIWLLLGVAPLVRQAPADAQWISCGNYYQGLPWLTGRRVVVLGGTGELAFGRDRLPLAENARWFRDDSRDLGTVARGLRSENPSRPVWALVSRGAWKELPPEQRQAWQPVDHNQSTWLVRLEN